MCTVHKGKDLTRDGEKDDGLGTDLFIVWGWKF